MRKVVAMSDSNGYIYDKDGIQLAVVKEIKEIRKGQDQRVCRSSTGCCLYRRKRYMECSM